MISDFFSFCLGLGYHPPLPLIENEYVRFMGPGDKPGQKNSFYLYRPYKYGGNGEVGTWHGGRVSHQWSSFKESDLAPEEWAEIQAEQKKLRQEMLEKTRESQRKVSERVKNMLEDCVPADPNHPYLLRKKVKPFGIFQKGPNLVIPVKAGEKIVNIQTISPDGKKLFEKGGRKKGCWFPIGEATSTVILCEGYATGASIHMATGLHVWVCFDLGNMAEVASIARQILPEKTLILAGDDDVASPGNPGRTRTTACAERLGLKAIFPSSPVDFNDLHCANGLDFVGAEIRARLDKSLSEVENVDLPSLKEEVRRLNGYPDLRFKSVKIEGEETRKIPVAPMSTVSNVLELMKRIGASARYHVFKRDIEITINGFEFNPATQLEDSCVVIESFATIAGMSTKSIAKIVKTVANQNQYNPIVDWILSRSWDGVSRIGELCDTIQHDPEKISDEFKAKIFRKWLLNAVFAAIKPNGHASHGVLILTGLQGGGKTEWLKSLVPRDMDLVLTGHQLVASNKDNVFEATSFWLVELGELESTFKKSDVDSLKNFITRDRDTLTRKYDRFISSYPRKTVYFGSVNREDFLIDETGNRRFWPIPTLAINYEHTVDMQQLWAEVYQLAQSGEIGYLLPEELDELNKYNEGFEAVSGIEEKIAAEINWDSPESLWQWQTLTQVVEPLLGKVPGRSELIRAGKIVSRLNGGRKKIIRGIRQYFAPKSLQSF